MMQKQHRIQESNRSPAPLNASMIDMVPNRENDKQQVAAFICSLYVVYM